MEFHNLKTLFGTVLTSHEALIANDPATHPNSGGLPNGHPPLNSFLGLPVLLKKEIIAMIGIANKPNGYNDQHITTLVPILTAIAFLINMLNTRWDEKQSGI